MKTLINIAAVLKYDLVKVLLFIGLFVSMFLFLIIESKYNAENFIRFIIKNIM